MKFDLHNLPFLAGGIDWSGEMYPNKGTGFCPGLYFIKKPISWGKNGYAIDAGSYRPTTPAEAYAGSDTKKWIPNWQWVGEGGKYKNLVEFILDQPNPKEYVAPYCLDSQTDRYPKDDCCDPTGEGGIFHYTGNYWNQDGYAWRFNVNNKLYTSEWLNSTQKCGGHCEDCNYIPNRWNFNQYQLFCPDTPDGYVKSWLNTPLEENCNDAVTQPYLGAKPEYPLSGIAMALGEGGLGTLGMNPDATIWDKTHIWNSAYDWNATNKLWGTGEYIYSYSEITRWIPTENHSSWDGNYFPSRHGHHGEPPWSHLTHPISNMNSTIWYANHGIKVSKLNDQGTFDEIIMSGHDPNDKFTMDLPAGKTSRWWLVDTGYLNDNWGYRDPRIDHSKIFSPNASGRLADALSSAVGTSAKTTWINGVDYHTPVLCGDADFVYFGYKNVQHWHGWYGRNRALGYTGVPDLFDRHEKCLDWNGDPNWGANKTAGFDPCEHQLKYGQITGLMDTDWWGSTAQTDTLGCQFHIFKRDNSNGYLTLTDTLVSGDGMDTLHHWGNFLFEPGDTRGRYNNEPSQVSPGGAYSDNSFLHIVGIGFGPGLYVFQVDKTTGRVTFKDKWDFIPRFTNTPAAPAGTVQAGEMYLEGPETVLWGGTIHVPAWTDNDFTWIRRTDYGGYKGYDQALHDSKMPHIAQSLIKGSHTDFRSPQIWGDQNPNRNFIYVTNASAGKPKRDKVPYYSAEGMYWDRSHDPPVLSNKIQWFDMYYNGYFWIKQSWVQPGNFWWEYTNKGTKVYSGPNTWPYEEMKLSKYPGYSDTWRAYCLRQGTTPNTATWPNVVGSLMVFSINQTTGAITKVGDNDSINPAYALWGDENFIYISEGIGLDPQGYGGVNSDCCIKCYSVDAAGALTLKDTLQIKFKDVNGDDVVDTAINIKGFTDSAGNKFIYCCTSIRIYTVHVSPTGVMTQMDYDPLWGYGGYKRDGGQNNWAHSNKQRSSLGTSNLMLFPVDIHFPEPLKEFKYSHPFLLNSMFWYWGPDGAIDKKIPKSPDHWMYICQNPKNECLAFRTWEISNDERGKVLNSVGKWRPPCKRYWHSRTSTPTDDQDFCIEFYNTDWKGRNPSSYNIPIGARTLSKPLIWGDPSLFDYHGPTYAGGGGEGKFGCRYPEQTRHRLYDDFPDLMRCYVDYINEVRKSKFGITSSVGAETTMSIFEIDVHLRNKYWGGETIGAWRSWAKNFTYSERCQMWGFYGLQHLFIPGICGGGHVWWDVVAAWLENRNTLPSYPDDPPPHEKYCCDYHPSWLEQDFEEITIPNISNNVLIGNHANYGFQFYGIDINGKFLTLGNSHPSPWNVEVKTLPDGRDMTVCPEHYTNPRDSLNPKSCGTVAGIWATGDLVFVPSWNICSGTIDNISSYKIDSTGGLILSDSHKVPGQATKCWGTENNELYVISTPMFEKTGTEWHIEGQFNCPLGSSYGEGYGMHHGPYYEPVPHGALTGVPAAESGGLYSFTFDSNGSLTYKGLQDDRGHNGGSGFGYPDGSGRVLTGYYSAGFNCEARSIWGSGDLIYVAWGASGLHSYSSDGAGNLTHIDGHYKGDYAPKYGSWEHDGTFGPDGTTGYGSWARDVWGDENFIYVANFWGGLLSYSADGAGNLTFKDGITTELEMEDQRGSQHGPNLYQYTAFGDSNQFTTAAVFPYPYVYRTHGGKHSDARSVWADKNSNVFLANNWGGIHSFKVDAAGKLTHVDNYIVLLPGYDSSSYAPGPSQTQYVQTYDHVGHAVYIRGDENFIYASEVDSGLTSLRVDVAGNMNFIDSIDIWGADSMWGGMWEYSPSFVYPNKAGSPQGLLIDKTESVKRSTRITNIDKAVPGSYAWGHVFGAPLNSKYKFCAFGPEFAVGTDGSWLFGGWHYTCKQAWDDAQMVRLALGCEDEFGNPKPADIEMPAECMLDVQMPYVNAGEPLTPYMQAGSKEKKMHLNACVPCESWNETTATFTRNVGLFFVPAPPIGADSLGGTGDSCDLPIAIADNYRLRYEKTTFEVRPLKDFPATLDAVDCDDSSIKDLYRHQHWVITPKEKRTAVKMIYSGAFGDSVHADIFSDHGSGVFHTGMAVTDVVNCNHRTQEKWEITRPFFYEIEDTCNILDVMPEGSNFWLHTNSPLVEGTNNGKTYILYKPQTRLGPFPVDTKVVVDYYKESEYIAQSNWMCLKDYFMLIMPPRVDRSFTPHRLQSFHGAGHVFTHVSARKREHIQTRKPYWFMNWMSEYHCVYDEAFNGSRIADLYFQIDDAQFEFNYGLCNILTGPSS